jgi:hypothetical protein
MIHANKTPSNVNLFGCIGRVPTNVWDRSQDNFSDPVPWFHHSTRKRTLYFRKKTSAYKPFPTNIFNTKQKKWPTSKIPSASSTCLTPTCTTRVSKEMVLMRTQLSYMLFVLLLPHQVQQLLEIVLTRTYLTTDPFLLAHRIQQLLEALLPRTPCPPEPFRPAHGCCR